MHDSAFLTYSCITYYQFFKLTKLLGGGGKTIGFIGGGATAPSTPRIDASGGDSGGDLQKKGWAGKSVRVAHRALHTDGVQGPAVGPPGPLEALEFSANKGLQNGRQEW